MRRSLDGKEADLHRLLPRASPGSVCDEAVPAHKPPADPECPRDHADGRRTGTALRVLLIEDNESHALFMRKALEKRDHGVIVVLGCAAAMASLSQRPSDVVALDYQLPDCNGLDALEKITARFRALPVVMVTAWGSERVAVEALKRGARDYVIKRPGYENELVRALELAAAKARAEAAEAALRAELEKRARTDGLTGLLNRGEMERLLRLKVKRARRRGFCFLLADVDLLKVINDAHGHSVGDEVLRRIACALRRSTRASDFVARWGGDEFAVLLPGAGVAVAESFAARLERVLSYLDRGPCGGTLPRVTLSAGLLCVPQGGPSPSVVLRWADRALYAAKLEGGNRVKTVVMGRKDAAGTGPEDLADAAPAQAGE